MRIAGFDALNLIGALLVVIGGLALVAGAATYPIGTLQRMGPGYFPMVTGFILAGIGAGLVIESRIETSTLPRVRIRPIVAVFAGLLWFAMTIERFGLAPSILGLVVLTSLAQDRPRPVMIAATALFLIAFSIGIFVYALMMPIPTVRF
ncbi:MAG: tripartite tricarboxylate transporter TctB family protein [Geminicoccaceae bacterium]